MEKIKILIVEDEILSAMALKAQLESSGYNVCSIVSGGNEAINQSQLQKPDLVLMDILLDDNISGIEAVSKIHEKQDTPVIYITAQEDTETLKDIIKTKYIKIIAKPYNFQDLNTTIHDYFKDKAS